MVVPGRVPASAVAAHLLLLGTLVACGCVVTVAAWALRRAEAAARHQASHDALTALANRRTLLEVLDAALRPDTGATAALVVLDLDGFKAVNDRYGHARGDDVLREVASRLTAGSRAEDVVCRLGGDEFAVVLHGVADEGEALASARRLAGVLQLAVTEDAFVGDAADLALQVRASTGVRLLVPGRISAASALRDADVALYRAKDARSGVVEVWRDGMRRAGEELDALAEDLRRALRGDGLRLVYQPVVDAGTLRVRGVEALARWRHPRARGGAAGRLRDAAPSARGWSGS